MVALIGAWLGSGPKQGIIDAFGTDWAIKSRRSLLLGAGGVHVISQAGGGPMRNSVGRSAHPDNSPVNATRAASLRITARSSRARGSGLTPDATLHSLDRGRILLYTFDGGCVRVVFPTLDLATSETGRSLFDEIHLMTRDELRRLTDWEL